MQLHTEFNRLFRTIRTPIGPTVSPASFFGPRKSRARLPFPFSHPRIFYTHSGSDAIYHAAAVLGLSDGDRVLVPAYNCGGELEPLLRRRLALDFYAVDRQMRIDWNDLEKKITPKTRAILLAHYFGFPQPLDRIRALCNSRQLYLLEDCAHALFIRNTTDYLGTTGDVAVFSLRKTLPLPNGGALVVSAPTSTTVQA